MTYSICLFYNIPNCYEKRFFMNLFLIISTTCITTILIFYIFNCRLHIKKNTELSNALQKTTESNTTLQKQESIATTKAEERSRSLEQQSSTIIKLREEIKKLTEDRASLKSELDAKETIIQTINSQHLQDMKNMREKLGAEFENLTTKLLKSNSKEFADVSREKIEQLILPLQEKIKIFENNIQYLQTTTSQERLTLTTNIKSIVESNSVLAKQTEDLKRALKGDIQKQGAWGELILETVLKSSGLRKGHEYTIHGEGLELKDTEGQRQHPDIIINLPDDRHLIIDSKSSYPHYEDYLTAENELEKSDSLKKLIISIQNHVKTL